MNLRQVRDNDRLREKLAGEYVLGTLRGGARRRFEGWMRDDAVLRRSVAEWQDRLHPMAEFAPAAQPSPQVWQTIERRLNLRPSRRAYWLSLREDISFWRGLGMVSTAVALILVSVLLTRLPEPGAPVTSYVATLTNEQAQPVIVITGDAKHRQLTVKVAVTPGPQFHFGRIDITGPQTTPPGLARKALTLEPGDPIVAEDVEAAEANVSLRLPQQGYPFVKVGDRDISLDPDTRLGDYLLPVSPGPRSSFSGFQLKGDRVFTPGHMAVIARFKPGDPYDGAKLLELRRAFADSDYFEQAEIISQYDRAVDRRIPILLELTPRKPARYSAGLGYATDTGVRGMLGFEKRRANESGDRYSIILRDSQILSSVTARYQVPLRRPATDSLTYNVSWVSDDTDTLESIKTSTGADLTQQTGPWLRTVGLSGFEDYYPYQLSGGMRKRVSLAAALINKPSMLLMDEPFSALDVQTRAIMSNELLRLWERTRPSVIFVTHDLEEAIALADRVVVMTAGPATVKAVFDIDLPRSRGEVQEIRFHPRFLDLYQQIWESLREEVQKAYSRTTSVSNLQGSPA